MIEIARNYKIEYDPDPTMFLVSVVMNASSFTDGVELKLIKYDK